MAVIGLLTELFDWGSDAFTPMLWLLVPVTAALVLRGVSTFRNLRVQGDAIEYVGFIIPCFVYLIELVLVCVVNILTWDEPRGILAEVEDAWGPRLHVEALVLSILLLALCVLFSAVSRRYNHRAQRRPLPLVCAMQNPLDLMLAVYVMVRAAAALAGPMPLSGRAAVSDASLGGYLFAVLLLGFQVASVFLSLVFSVLLTNRRSEAPGKGPNPLARLRYKVRRQAVRSSVMWLVLLLFLSACMLPALLSEYGPRSIDGADAPFADWRLEYVSVTPRSVVLVREAYVQGNDLLYAAVTDDMGIYLVCDPAQTPALLQGQTAKLRGKLVGIGNQGTMGSQYDGRLPLTPEYYVNLTQAPEYGAIWLVLGLLGVFLLVGLRFYLPAIRPDLSGHIRPLRRLYPGFDEMMAEIGAEEAGGGVLYRDDFHLVTASYAVTERFDTIRLTAFRQVAAVHPEGELMFQVRLHSGVLQTLTCPNAQAREAVVRALREHWRVEITPKPAQPPAGGACPPPPVYHRQGMQRPPHPQGGFHPPQGTGYAPPPQPPQGGQPPYPPPGTPVGYPPQAGAPQPGTPGTPPDAEAGWRPPVYPEPGMPEDWQAPAPPGQE